MHQVLQMQMSCTSFEKAVTHADRAGKMQHDAETVADAKLMQVAHLVDVGSVDGLVQSTLGRCRPCICSGNEEEVSIANCLPCSSHLQCNCIQVEFGVYEGCTEGFAVSQFWLFLCSVTQFLT